MRVSRRSVLKSGSAAALLAGTGRSVFAQGPTIQIGFPYELSGKFVAYGAAGKRGSEMALEAFNNKAGKFTIEPLWRDVQSEPQATASIEATAKAAEPTRTATAARRVVDGPTFTVSALPKSSMGQPPH